MTENSALFRCIAVIFYQLLASLLIIRSRFYARELLLGLIDLLEHSTHQLLTVRVVL